MKVVIFGTLLAKEMHTWLLHLVSSRNPKIRPDVKACICCFHNEAKQIYETAKSRNLINKKYHLSNIICIFVIYHMLKYIRFTPI